MNDPTDGHPAVVDSDGPADHDPGPANHLALFYESFDEQLATVNPFVRQGFDRGHRVIDVVDDNPRDPLAAAYGPAGIDGDRAVDDGVLSFHEPRETYGPTDEFDPAAMIGSLESTVEDDGHDHLRITGEMTWALSGDGATAQSLGVSQPTFSGHLCAGHQKVYRELFGPRTGDREDC